MSAARERAILSEDRQSSLRVLADAGQQCEHRKTTVLEHMGGGMEDHATSYMACQTCGRGLVVTVWLSRADVDVRYMTPREAARFGVR